MNFILNDLTGCDRLTKGIKYKYAKSIVGIDITNDSQITLTLNWIPLNNTVRMVYMKEVPTTHMFNHLYCSVDDVTFDKYLVYDNYLGYYRFRIYCKESIYTENIRVVDKFPYLLQKCYEASELMDNFKNCKIIPNFPNDIVDKELSNKLAFTFGIEFETACGLIPQEKCFKDGLIPLHDGSITGIEYSTVVMDSSFGLPLLKQQLADLKKYTFTNKECALHIHMGGFPVSALEICILQRLCVLLESTDYDHTIPDYSFYTDRYKASGKSYCKIQPSFSTFADLYSYFAEMPFFGDFSSSHPSDPERTGKWRVAGRYYALNLINMLCYQGPKTIEFRFLRPTFNYRKIRYWLAVFNALLLYSKKLANKWRNSPFKSTIQDPMEVVTLVFSNEIVPRTCSYLTHIINSTYCDTKELNTQLLKDYDALKCVIIDQENIGDFIGSSLHIEDALFKDVL